MAPDVHLKPDLSQMDTGAMLGSFLKWRFVFSIRGYLIVWYLLPSVYSSHRPYTSKILSGPRIDEDFSRVVVHKPPFEN